MSDEPLRCAGALILDDEGRVFVRRPPQRPLFPYPWDIVGGTVQPGESVEAALHREVQAETGWQISMVLGSVGEVTYAGDDGVPRVEEDFLIRVDGDLSRPRPADGGPVEFRWITGDELDVVDEDRAPGDLVLRHILEAGFATVDRLGR